MHTSKQSAFQVAGIRNTLQGISVDLIKQVQQLKQAHQIQQVIMHVDGLFLTSLTSLTFPIQIHEMTHPSGDIPALAF
jgi:hypothetical protein